MRGETPIKAAETGPAAQLLAQQAIFLVHFDGMNQAVQLGAQFLHVKRFGHVVGRAEPRGLDGRRDRAVLRQHDDGGFGIVGAGSLEQLQAAKLRNLQIRDHDVDRILVQNLQRLLGGRRDVHLQPGVGGHVPA